jgi:hypothetical protein
MPTTSTLAPPARVAQSTFHLGPLRADASARPRSKPGEIRETSQGRLAEGAGARSRNLMRGAGGLLWEAEGNSSRRVSTHGTGPHTRPIDRSCARRFAGGLGLLMGCRARFGVST